MKRIYGLDYLSVYTVLLVFFFHAWMNLGCDFGKLGTYISVGAVYMTLFYMLSGFVLYLKYQDILIDANILKKFYLKRMSSILPIYWISVLIYILCFSKETVRENIVLIPIELCGLQSLFSSLFSVSHNGGTWFISCLIFCYLLCPFLMVVTRTMDVKDKLWIVILVQLLLWLSPVIVTNFHTNEIYTNPILRSLEFWIGIILASLMPKISKLRKVLNLPTFVGTYIITVITIWLLSKFGVPHVMYMGYSCILIPVFAIQILLHAIAKFKGNRLLTYCSAISYAFFLAQLFSFKITQIIASHVNLNLSKEGFVIAFVLNSIIAVILHELVEKPVGLIIKIRTLNK